MEFFGKLDMNDDGEFIIHTEAGTTNISKILNDIFDSQLRPLVYVRVAKCGNLLFEEDGRLTIAMDEQRVESFYICGLNLSKLLFYETNEVLEITVRKERKTKGLYGKS
ncbi:MAG: hypothetical protein LLF98_02250 [Clostridium sp.]|uniref:hypothetical protein n=1 Tax=Clostridium sp. TaxID=1506 RepID=UPI0025C25C49|nr:hypothetical protein [Clostridium sp.]MCE5220103.1 hypothetical protein [Clostridium sp.]